MINLNIFWHVFQFLVFIILGMFFLFKVFEDNLTVSKKEYWVRAFIHIILLTAVICLFLTQVSPFPNKVLGSSIIIVLSIALYKFMTRKSPVFLLFILFVLLNVQSNAFFLARTTLDAHIFPKMSAYENGDLLLLASIYCFLIFLVVYFTLEKYYKRIVNENIILKHTKLFFCIPLIFFTAICIFVSSLYKQQTGIEKDFFLPLVLLNLFALISYYAALKSIVDSYDAAAEHERLFAAKTQLDLWENQYKTLQSKIDADTRKRHDWRQHIITIMGFAESRDLDGLEDYLKDYKEKYLIPDKPPICDIASLNLLFQYYQRKAEDMDIRMSVNSVYFGRCSISPSELSVLFGNLLENALEACAHMTTGSKYINFRILRESERIIFSCENSFDGTIHKDKDKFLSRKDNGGAGISSIEGIIQKYGGHLKIQNSGNIFKIFAFLQDKP